VLIGRTVSNQPQLIVKKAHAYDEPVKSLLTRPVQLCSLGIPLRPRYFGLVDLELPLVNPRVSQTTSQLHLGAGSTPPAPTLEPEERQSTMTQPGPTSEVHCGSLLLTVCHVRGFNDAGNWIAFDSRQLLLWRDNDLLSQFYPLQGYLLSENSNLCQLLNDERWGLIGFQDGFRIAIAQLRLMQFLKRITELVYPPESRKQTNQSSIWHSVS
jgi:hypothetical protein